MGMSFVVALSNKVYHPAQLDKLKEDFQLATMELTGESDFTNHMRFNRVEWTMSVGFGEKGTVIVCPFSGLAEGRRVMKASADAKTALITYNDNAMLCYINVYENEQEVEGVVYAKGEIQFGELKKGGDVFSYATALFEDISGTGFDEYTLGLKMYDYTFTI